ncbi:hypothetical protein FHX44_11423 [Pseudonocardia hierapolitana]|uniref:Uncharacterized protein n=1 Tax=Pseudonocardia hierapolitana TaxID=1128676 RepID=A0A561SIA6_9PSEU|nr:hypothetical protein [Pseudonocardia hierapolitana]TWF74542.1 hypothetical protein FHX44_11423 [Pseudonocardia hierapolitana]
MSGENPFMPDVPDELTDPDAPPGSAPMLRYRSAPVWCVHGVRWQRSDIGYVADDAMAGPHIGHRDPALDVGAIPCQPTYASYQGWRVTALARAADLEGREPL